MGGCIGSNRENGPSSGESSDAAGNGKTRGSQLVISCERWWGLLELIYWISLLTLMVTLSSEDETLKSDLYGAAFVNRLILSTSKLKKHTLLTVKWIVYVSCKLQFWGWGMCVSKFFWTWLRLEMDFWYCNSVNEYRYTM